MSIPTNNLYDFIHQATKRKFWLVYFSPWGSRNLLDVVDHCSSHEHPNLDNTISWKDRVDKDIFAPESCNDESLRHTQPVLFCHDQEPLMFDLYRKDSPLVKNFFQGLGLVHNHLVDLDLNLRWTVQFSMQKYFVLLHSEVNSPEVAKYENSGLFKTAFWWSHAIIARDWYRFAKVDSGLEHQPDIKNLFLVYCRDTSGYRTYRKNFLNLLDSHRLNNHCYIPSLTTNVDAQSSASYVSSDFSSTAISVVLETVFDQRIHLTEKILRPIACGHPFVVAAGPGTLEFLKRYGFKTFAPYINETYDTITDPQQRLAAMVEEMRRISQLNSKDLKHLIKRCRAIAQHNKKVFFSDKFQQLVINELEQNVEQAFAATNNELSFENCWTIRKLYRSIGGTMTRHGYKREAVFLCRQQRLANRAR